MIKIDLNKPNEILQFHYNNLIKKKDRKDTIISFLDKRIAKANGDPFQDQLRNMYIFLKSKVLLDNNGFSILTATPNELDDFKTTFEENFEFLLNSIYKPQNPPKKNILYRDELLKIFYYSEYDKWKAYELAKKINVNVCPYCNRSYTFVIGNDSNKGTRFEYDHFFDKVRYPYLALSFYNLIPSCHICNSMKGSEKFEINNNIHPYLEGFGNDLLFTIKPKNINFINAKSSAYRIKFKKDEQSSCDRNKLKSAIRNISVFRLNELYNMHKDYVDEIIQKSIVYNEDYIKNLYTNFGNLFSSEDDVKRMVLGNYISLEDYSKRPLSKLTADISKELGLLK